MVKRLVLLKSWKFINIKELKRTIKAKEIIEKSNRNKKIK